MTRSLEGLKVAMLATDGVEQAELTDPKRALEEAGAVVHVIAPKADAIQAVHHDDKGDRIPVDRSLDDAKSADYEALVLPGGVKNPDRLRTDKRAVQFVREFMAADKPVAAICHGPWLLVEADAVRGRTITSWPSLKTDITNAGGSWVDQAVVEDQKLVTSRKPEDLPHFNAKIVRVFGESAVQSRLDEQVEQSFPASDPPPGPTAIGTGGRGEAEARA